jgi:predicted transcriptional regulator
MPKIPSLNAFFNVNKALLLILGPYETIVLAYVAEWQAKGKPCFSSRKTIAVETGFSEKTVQNTVKSLVGKGYLAISHYKRKRILTLTDKGGISYPQRGYKILSEGVRDTQMRGYDVLTTNKEITNKDITNKKLLKSDLVFKETEKEPMGKESEKEKELRLRLNALRNDPQGWEDHGSYLTKFDPETRTTLRKAKPVHAEKTWNGKGDWSDLPE